MSGLVFGVVRGVIIGVPTGLRFGVEAVSDPSGVASLSAKLSETFISLPSSSSSLSFSIPYQVGALVVLPPLVIPLF